MKFQQLRYFQKIKSSEKNFKHKMLFSQSRDYFYSHGFRTRCVVCRNQLYGPERIRLTRKRRAAGRKKDEKS